MRLPRPRPRNDPDNLVPLINVVFLLLIFLMLIGEIARFDPFDVSPPASSGTGTEAAGETTVYLARDGRIAVDDSEMRKEDLAFFLRMKVRKEALDTIRFKVDQDADATAMIGLMTLMKRAGIANAQLVTERRAP